MDAVKSCVSTVVQGPLHKACKLTIPVSEKDKWHRGFAIANPSCCLLFCFIAFNSKSKPPSQE